MRLSILLGSLLVLSTLLLVAAPASADGGCVKDLEGGGCLLAPIDCAAGPCVSRVLCEGPFMCVDQTLPLF